MQTVKMAAFLLLAILFVSCDIFNTRDSEEPVLAGSNEEFPSSPEILMNNLSAAITGKNAQNYVSCFTDSAYAPAFRFIPSNSSVNIYPVLSGFWDVRAERRYFENMLLQVNSNKAIDFALTGVKLTRYTDSAHYSSHYVIAVPLKNTEEVLSYEGDIQFTMVLDSRSRWAIRSWTDVNSAKKLCWSDLKGFFY